MNFRNFAQILTTVTLFLFGSCDQYLSSEVEEARQSRINGDIATIGVALSGYERRAKTLPTTEQGLNALVEKPTPTPAPDNWIPYMKMIPKDPWDQEYQYRYTPDLDGSSGGKYDVWSLGSDGKTDTGDDVGNW